jgi:hypothetical protein
MLIVWAILGLIAVSWSEETQNVGSASVLHGSIDLAIVFVSDANTRWTLREQKIMKRQIRYGSKWIELSAKRYGVYDIDFKDRTYGRWNNVHLDWLPSGTRSGNEDVQLVSTVSNKLGFEKPQQFRNQHNGDQFIALICLKRDGASYAIPQEVGISERFDIEGAVLYQNFDTDVPNCATCIAHEILHLFGGWDLYQTFQTSEDQEKEARILFPDSVMLRTSYDMSDVEIDPLTAWRIGWSEQPTGAYFFQPTYSE